MEKTERNYALITGATSGIGYEFAKIFVAEGYNLIIVARSDERLEEVASELRSGGREVMAINQDLFDPQAATRIYDEVRTKGLRVDVLVNNAAQGQLGKFNEIPLERHLSLIQLNIASVVALTRLFLDDMVSRNEGRILNVASVVSKTPAPEFSVYAASKAFVLSFSEALAKELEDSNVFVTALLPGRTDTAFFARADMEESKEYQEHMLADPATVAKDGYDALMRGDNRVISGAQNHMMVGMMNSMPDSANAGKMQKNMQPSEKNSRRREHPSHGASGKEKEEIEKTGRK